MPFTLTVRTMARRSSMASSAKIGSFVPGITPVLACRPAINASRPVSIPYLNSTFISKVVTFGLSRLNPPQRIARQRWRNGMSNDTRVLVVLGAGAAGAYAVEAVREAGYTGRVILITQENELPYDRPNCSKDYLQGEAEEAWMFLRTRAFYDEHNIEVRTGQSVASVDAASKTLRFGNNEVINYDALVLCTGSAPRHLDVPGATLDGVFTLRSYVDSQKLREAAQNASRAVVIGASFIGLEAAFSMRQLGLEVSVVAPEPAPL